MNKLKAPLMERVGRFVSLMPGERRFLEELQSRFDTVRSGAEIVSAGHGYRSLFVLSRGTAIRYKVLHDGRRQILNLVLPGDIIGFPGCLFDKSLYSIAAIDDAVVCPVSFDVLFGLFRSHPRLGTALFWQVGHESALFAEHLVGVGRRSAYERVAHLLLEFLVRLQQAGLADQRSYQLPMTQALMADSLGLSVPHVNRTLRRLREDGLIAVKGTRLTCLDVAALSRLAGFDGPNLTAQRIVGL
ncbi:MAG: Crp/Fnr family transcriptional regulator [Enhydrobacter sp.]|nr:Crp/Fnr family transcriptional regulator [Enhydrobacter sp.]